ncbi:MAG: polyphosphate kinase 1 [Bacteroidota bacterium]
MASIGQTVIFKEEQIPYIHRDISWLSFNYRVLQEAKDPAVPLLERIKFLAIYSSNLSEFFKVRIANQRYLLRSSKKTRSNVEFDPKEVIKTIQRILKDHQQEFTNIVEKEIVPELEQYGVRLLRRLDLNEEQEAFVKDYFQDQMLPYVQPVLLVKDKIRPFLNNDSLYLSIWMTDKSDSKKQAVYAIVNIPTKYLPRFVELPSQEGQHNLIILDDIVRYSISFMFPGYDIVDTYSIKLTRDAELYIDDEFSGDLIKKIKESITKREVGVTSRFVYDRTMPKALLDFLSDTFHLERYDIFQEGRYHNNFDFFKFPDFGKSHLLNTPLPELSYAPLEESEHFFDKLAERDHLLYFPYHSYESVVRFFEAAAHDPDVTHIKITQYRVARRSRIMNALMEAVKLGKQVSVFIEVKARFDEEANLRWGEKLEAAGVQVRYSFPGVKVHSKLGLVRRQEGDTHKLYTYLSTGNFHEVTAKIYSDFGLFTADKRITVEVARLFSYLETLEASEFEHLLVGQFNLRPRLHELIDREITFAQAGLPAKIILKMNSLQDKEMIAKLYEASQAGVNIQLIVRGICSLIPQLKGWSKNVDAISIVDRYLEHARVFIFHNQGNEDIYMSSADWMVRNLSHRIEATFPIYDEQLKKEVKEYIDIQLNDNTKARILDKDQSNTYHKLISDISIRSQVETYYHLKRKIEREVLETERGEKGELRERGELREF